MNPKKVIPFTGPVDLIDGDKADSNGYCGGGGEPPMISERLSRLETHVAHIQNEVSNLRDDMRNLRDEIGNMRWWILSSCLATILGVASIVVAFGQYQASWFQNSLSQTMERFEKESDRNWEAAQKALERIDENRHRVDRMEIRQQLQQEQAASSNSAQ